MGGGSCRWFKSQLQAELSCKLKCPWAIYWTPNCSWCTVGTLHGGLCHQWGPCDEKGIKRLQAMDGWMDGWMDGNYRQQARLIACVTKKLTVPSVTQRPQQWILHFLSCNRIRSSFENHHGYFNFLQSHRRHYPVVFTGWVVPPRDESKSHESFLEVYLVAFNQTFNLEEAFNWNLI